MLQSNINAAINYLESALEYSVILEDKQYMAVCYSKIGKYNFRLKNYEIARFNLKKSLNLSLLISLNNSIIENYQLLSNLEKGVGNYKLSNVYLEKYIDVKDSISSEKYNKDLVRVQTKFKVKFKEEKILEEKEKKKMWQTIFIISLALFIGIVVIGLLSRNRLQLKRMVEKVEQEKNMQLSETKAIKSQMNPHFIFNSLNSIQDLVLKQDGKNAYNYINKFAILMRKVLNHSDSEYIDIEEELYVLKTYLDLEKLRFKKDFTYNINVNNTSDIELPPMLIQPFVENALKHGLLYKKGEKTLSIDFKIEENILICEIIDNGIGRKKSEEIKLRQSQSHRSFSVHSTENRFELLQELHGVKLGIKYIDLIDDLNNSEGTKVILNLPFKLKY